MWTLNFQMFKMDLGKALEPETKLSLHLLDHWKGKRIPEKKIYFCFIGYAKTFDCVDHKKTGKSLKGWEYQTILHASWETCMQAKKQQLELVM